MFELAPIESARSFGAPGQRDDARRALVVAGVEHGFGRLGDQHDHRGRALLDAVRHFERRQAVVELLDIGAAIDLGQHDAAGIGRHDRGEIEQGIGPVEGIDPHPQAMALLRIGLDKIVHHRPRRRLVVGRDRVLEIDQHDVGRAFHRLGHLLLAVAGREQPGAGGDGLVVVGHVIPCSPRTGGGCPSEVT